MKIHWDIEEYVLRKSFHFGWYELSENSVSFVHFSGFQSPPIKAKQ